MGGTSAGEGPCPAGGSRGPLSSSSRRWPPDGKGPARSRCRCRAAARQQGAGSPRAACARREPGQPRAVRETSGNSRAEVTARGRSFLFAAEVSCSRWCGHRLLAGRAAAESPGRVSAGGEAASGRSSPRSAV